jgi:hypothetical protein
MSVTRTSHLRGAAGLLVGLGLAVAPAAPSGSIAPSTPATAPAAGDLMAFGPSGADRSGVAVRVVEDPAFATVTDAGGHWAIDGIPVGSLATFELDGPGWYPIRTATLTVPADGLERVAFQAPSTALVDALEGYLGVESNPTRCHLATTVTRAGFSLYGGAPDGTHGEPGATVTIDPPPAQGGTPIYWNGSRFDTIWPDRSLDATTADGGVLFANVTPGTYTLQAHKPGVTFRPATVTCAAGVLTNAAPPWGIQAVAGGLGPTDTVPFPTATTTTGAPSTATTTTTSPAAPAPTPAATPLDGAATYTG